jgi:hypothetical protein
MDELLSRVRTRLLPALLTASGVMLIAAGLMSYTAPADALVPSPTPTAVAASATPTPRPSATATPSIPPSVEPSASPSPTFPADRVATRVVVPALTIDLPVITPPGGPDAYPLCDVAMFIKELGQPGQGRATYLYAHARTGMFLPILESSRINNGAGMIGMLVEVYTSDDMLFLYEITEVRRNQTSLDDAIAAAGEELWLQTSEGPRGTPGKTQVIAKPLSSGPADPAEAHPSPKPVVCG